MKKIFIFLQILFIPLFTCFSQTTEMKNYSDYSKNFSGSAVAVYYGNIKDLDAVGYENEFLEYLSEEIGDTLPEVKKLTKNNNWLFRQALNEWDYEKGEVYGVVCADSKYSTTGILMFVIIRGKDDFLWKAYTLNENNIDKFDELFNSTTEVTSIPSSDEYVSSQREIFDWYTSLGIIQTKTCDNPPATVRIDVAFGYNKDDKNTSIEITNKTVEIKAFLRRYFSEKTAEELKNTNNEDLLEKEIKDGLNDKIFTSGKIRDVVFQQKDIIEQK